MNAHRLMALSLALLITGACGDGGDDGVEADLLGVGAACAEDAACPTIARESEDGEDFVLVCLSQFKGGYCGLQGCTSHAECPEASACVSMDDGNNYCFRQCLDKPECNENRDADEEANCSSSVTFVEPDTPGKACVPPSGP